MILLSLLLIPLFGILLIAPSYRSYDLLSITNFGNTDDAKKVDPDTKLKVIALAISIIAFLYSLSLLLLFDPSTPEYQFTFNFNNKDLSIFTSYL